MISRFTVRNFKSIQDMTVSFSFAERKAPNGYRELEQLVFCENKKGRRFVPCLALYGANASGKTNIIMALQTLQKLVSGAPLDTLYSPNKLYLSINPTYFELEVDINGAILTYSVLYTQKEILYESLRENEENIYLITKNKAIFDDVEFSKTLKKYKNKDFIDVFYTECTENKKQIYSFLRCFANRFPDLNSSIKAIYRAIVDIIIPPKSEPCFSFGVDFFLKNHTNSEFKMAVDRIAFLLKKLDLDIVRMDIDCIHVDNKDYMRASNDSISAIKNVNNYEYIVHSYHLNLQGDEIEFNFTTDESVGTRNIAGLIGFCLVALDTGRTIILDDIDKSLHCLVLEEIISLFKDKRYNINNAQLLFATHNTELLDGDFLRISEVGIVNKTKIDGTTLHRISDFSEVKNVTNFRKQYLQGIFSGLPNAYV